MDSTLVQSGCDESLEGVDSSRIHHLGSALVYRGSGAYFKGLHTSNMHRIRWTLVYRGCSASLNNLPPKSAKKSQQIGEQIGGPVFRQNRLPVPWI